MKKNICLLLFVILTTTVVFNARAEVVVKQVEDRNAGTVLEISNRFIAFKLYPDKGGSIKSFKYEGTKFTTHEGILNDHLWDQKMKGDFWQKQYSYKLKKTKNSLTVTLKRTGTTGIYQFLEIKKSITITADSPALKISYTWLNRKNSMSKLAIKPWFHYLVSGAGENRYYAPEITGIKRFDWKPGDKVTERWLYECARGWVGVINPASGKGIVFTPEYRYLQSFYNWKNDKLSTLEWRFTPITIPCGKTFTTSFEMIPFNGLNMINGAGNGIVGELTDNKIHIFSTKAETVNITVTKSNGTVLKQATVKLNPNKITSVKFARNLNALTCKIAKNGKLLVDLKRGTPKNPLKFAWQPQQKRYHEVQVALPWRYKIADKLELPYIPVAKPWAGGKLKVFFLFNLAAIANVNSLKARMDIEPSYTTLPYSWWTLGWIPTNRMPTGWVQIAKMVQKEALKVLPKELKQVAPQVIVVGENYTFKYSKPFFGWSLLPKKIRQQLLTMTKNGTGLVIIASTPKQSRWTKDIAAIYQQAVPATEITANLALPNKFKNCAKIARYGKGTIIFLNYRASGLLPHLNYEQVKDRLQESLFSLPIRAILLAGHKLSTTGTVAQTESIYLRNGIEYKSKPQIAGEYTVAKISKNSAGKVLRWSFVKEQVVSANYLTSVTPTKELFHADENIGVKVKLNNALVDGQLQLKCFDNYGRLVKRLTASANRAEHTFKFKVANPLTVIYSVVVTLHKQDKIISRESTTLHLPDTFANKPPFMFHLWGGMTLQMPEYYLANTIGQARSIGFASICEGTMWRIASSSKYNADGNFRIALINQHRAGIKNPTAAKMNAQYKKSGNTKYLIRPKCFSDPAQRQAIQAKLKTGASAVTKYGTMLYMLGDEMSLTTEGGDLSLDICFSPHCLHKFQAELKKQYRSIGDLNRAWGSSFKGWTEIKPLTLEQALKQKRWGSWLAHRQFMDSVYADFFKWTSEAIRMINPGAMVGESGIHDKMSAYGGYDWTKRMKYEKVALFYGTGTMPMSFANRQQFNFSSWCLGYAQAIEKEKFDLWQALFRGQNMISCFNISIFVNPDQTPSYYGRGLTPIIAEVNNGIGAALAVADKQSSPVAIVISQKSLLTSFIQKQLGVIDTYQLYRSNISMWKEILMKYGYSPYFIDSAQLDSASLKQSGCRVIILPMTYVLSKKESAAVYRFVKEGGTVIADACTATWDANGNQLAKGRLDELFGLKRKNLKLTSTSVNYKFNGKRISASIVESGLTQRGKVVASQNKGAGSSFFGSISFGSKSADHRMTVNRYGQGKAYYFGALGLKLSYPTGSMALELLNAAGVKPFVTINSGKNIIPAENGTFRSGEINYFGVIVDESRDKSNKRVIFPIKGYVYEMRAGNNLGLTQNVVLPSTPAGAKLFAIVPQIPELNISLTASVKRGATAVLTVNSNIKGKYPLHISVRNPQGELVKPLSFNLFAPVKKVIPFALNDQPGSWEVSIKDVITGKVIRQKIEIK